MRRSVLLIGVVVALAVGGATGAYLNDASVERSRTHHIIVVKNNALCEKSLEMAASFSFYIKDKKLTDAYVETGTWTTEMLNGNLRREALALGFTNWEYDALLVQARRDAELAIIPQINNAADPAAKAQEIVQACVPLALDPALYN